MKYTVELIPKASVIADIIDFWRATGRPDNLPDGQFVFEDCEDADFDEGVFYVRKDGKRYFYNMQDFYRIKIIQQPDEQAGFEFVEAEP